MYILHLVSNPLGQTLLNKTCFPFFYFSGFPYCLFQLFSFSLILLFQFLTNLVFPFSPSAKTENFHPRLRYKFILLLFLFPPLRFCFFSIFYLCAFFFYRFPCFSFSLLAAFSIYYFLHLQNLNECALAHLRRITLLFLLFRSFIQMFS